MKLEHCILVLRFPAFAGALAATLALSACETPGLVSETTTSTFDVTEAEADDIAAALQDDGRVVLRGGVVFSEGSSVLSQQGNTAAARIAEVMRENPDLQVAVVGHTDNGGGFQYNLDLSERRARSMVDAIVANGVAGDRLAPVGVGPLAPAASNDTAEGRQENRRVEIVVAS